MSSKLNEISSIAVTRQCDALRDVVLALWESPTGTADIRRDLFDEALKATGLAQDRLVGRKRTPCLMLTAFGEATLRRQQPLEKTEQPDEGTAL